MLLYISGMLLYLFYIFEYLIYLYSIPKINIFPPYHISRNVIWRKNQYYSAFHFDVGMLIAKITSKYYRAG